MSLERIGNNFYTVAGDQVIDRVHVADIAEYCVFAALRQGLNGDLHSHDLNDLISTEWGNTRLRDKDLEAIRPTFQKMVKRAIKSLEAAREVV